MHKVNIPFCLEIMNRYIYQMVVFQRFLQSSGGSMPFYVSYQFDDFSSSRRVALKRCADYVSFLCKNHEVLSAQPFLYSSVDGFYEVLYEVVDDGKIEYYGIRKSFLWSSAE